MQEVRYIRSWVLLLALLGLVTAIQAQGVIPSKGKEFWLGFMRNWGQPSTNSSLDVFISGDVATSGTVSIPAAGISWPFTVTPGTTTTVNVPLNVALHAASEIVENKGVLVLAQDTISVFAINYEEFTAEGTVVYPVEALGTDHRVVSYTGIYNAGGEFLVVATKDGTELEITTTAMTLLGRPAGVPWVVALDSGQTYQVRAVDPTVDLTGSIVRSTEASGPCRPFAVFSGAACARVPTGMDCCCDHLYEQQLPVNAWGTVYHAAPFADAASYGYRILAHEDGTQVRINGGAPITLNAGQWYDDMNATTGTCFQGSRPFAVAQYMKSIFYTGVGDPSMLQLNAEEQRIDRITFSTVVSAIINQHFVNVVLATADIPTLTLDGAPVPMGQFTPFPACSDRSYAQLDLSPGSHTLACPNGFSAYVYGIGQEESYAYSVGSFTLVPPPPIFETICGIDVNGMVSLSVPRPIDGPAWSLLETPDDTLHLGDTYTFEPVTSALYQVTGTEGVSGCPVQFVFSVELETPPDLTLVASEAAVCAFTPVRLDVGIDPPGEYVIAWSPEGTLDDPTTASPTALPMTDTWYRVEVTTLSGCAMATDSVFVAASMGDILELRVVPDDTTICLGGEVPLVVTARQRMLYDTFEDGNWGPWWAQVQGAGTSTACGSVSGDALYFNGGIMRQASTIDLDLALGGVVRFALVIGTGVAPCENADLGDDVVLEFSTDAGATWTVMAIYAEWAYPAFTMIEEPIPAGGASINTRFRWRQLGTWTAGQDNWAIDDVLIARNGATPTSPVWSPPDGLNDANSASPFARPLASTRYTVTATDASGLCNHTATASIEVNEPFPITVTADTTVCTAVGLLLEVVYGVTGAMVQWEPAVGLDDATSPTPQVMLDSTQAYVVRVTAPDGCAAIDTVEVTVPFSDLAPPLDTTVCAGEQVTLDPGQPGALHAWSTGASTPTITVDEEGPFTVQLTDPIGCTAQWTADVHLVQPPVVELGNDTTFCAGGSLLLDPGAVGTHLWNDGSAAGELSVTTSGTWWVRVTNTDGCAASDTLITIVHPLPVVLLNDTTACAGTTVMLDAGSDGAAYLWTNGTQTATVTVDEGTTRIGVTVTGAEGCTTDAEAEITWLVFPTPMLGNDTVVCRGQSLVLDPATAAQHYLWSSNATTATITVQQGGVHWVRAANGPCAAYDTIQVTLAPTPPVLLPETLSFCPDDPPFHVVLNAGDAGNTYAWSVPPGQVAGSGHLLNATRSGTYSVTITSTDGCTVGDTVLILQDCPAALYVPNTFTPNNDGVNDVFRPEGYNIDDLELLIFNRWGELIARSIWPDAHWDGTYMGERSPDGVYPWYIRYHSVDAVSGRPGWKTHLGHVTLLR